jgi:hypothetical protein
VANPRVGAVDVLGENAVQLPHALGEIRIRRLDQEVVVVRHQAVGVNQPIEALAGCAQHIQERSPITIRIAEKDVSPLVAACRHMIQRAGKLQPQRSRHCCTPERLNPGKSTASCWGVQCET